MCLMFFNMFFFLFMILFLMSLNFMFNNMIYFLEFNFIMFNSTNISMLLLIDWMSLLFSSFVLLISSMVIYYSIDYMDGDLNLNRFILLVVLFVMSMMLLIYSPNLISILLGWDGLGLVSYCLVIYYQNNKSFNAGMLTALSNRVGDVLLLMSIAWMLNYGSWNFIFYVDLMKMDNEMKLISFMVVLAAMTKSAQIPFSSWLPAAMAAPTPVSALVHSSTLVTAGVYLLIRFNFSFNSNLMMFLLIISSLTMFMSGLGANFEFDLKKIIALSTLSQLGLMIVILSLGDYMLSFFHLLIHALFKALLFMCAGNIIHNLNNCQDIRYMGGMLNFMPLTFTYLNISNLSLCGLPFFSGFYSKDLIAEVMSMGVMNMFIYFIFYLSIGLTVCYSFRLFYYLMLGDFHLLSLNMLNEKGFKMLKGMSGLIMSVIFMGSLLSWMMFSSPYIIILPFFMKMLTLFMVMLGIFLGYELAKFKLSYNLSFMGSKFHFIFLMWNLPFISTLGINYYPMDLGKNYIKMLDQGWLEYFGSQNLFNFFIYFSKKLSFYFLKNFEYMLILLFFWLLIIFIFF